MPKQGHHHLIKTSLTMEGVDTVAAQNQGLGGITSVWQTRRNGTMSSLQWSG